MNEKAKQVLKYKLTLDLLASFRFDTPAVTRAAVTLGWDELSLSVALGPVQTKRIHSFHQEMS